MPRLDLHKSIAINGSVEAVFDALTDPTQITAYFPVDAVTIDPEVGGAFTIQGQTDEGAFTDHGTIEAFEPGRRFRYRYWSSNHGTERLPENHMVIDYRLAAVDGGTRVDLAHENLLDEGRQTMMDVAWEHLLGALKAHVETMVG